MSDSRSNDADTLEVPADLDDRQMLRQFFSDVIEVLESQEQRLQALEALLVP